MKIDILVNEERSRKLKKHKKLMNLVCIIGILILVASQIGYKGYDSLHPITLSTTETDPKVIAKQLFEKEMKTLTSYKMFFAYRLRDYTIDDVRAKRQLKGNISFAIDYSVKPKWSSRTYWVAGNGVDEGSWIKDKSCMGEIQYKDGIYILTGHGTGP